MIKIIGSLCSLLILAGCASSPAASSVQKQGNAGKEERVITLSERDRDRWLLASRDEGFRPVLKSGRPLVLSRDLNYDGISELLVLMVNVRSHEEAQYGRLADFSRLYNKLDRLPEFRVGVFFQEPGTLRKGLTFSLGHPGVLHHFGGQSLGEGISVPFAVETVFLSTKGQTRMWFVFSGVSDVSKIVLSENSRNRSYVTDYDLDGWVDLIFMEDLLSDTGVPETLMSIYRWNGEDFSLSSSLGLLEKLKVFLYEVSELTTVQLWSDLRYRLFLPGKRPKKSGQAQLLRVFQPIEGQEKNPEELRALLRNEGIDRLYLPEPSENPFIYEEGIGFFFDGLARIEFASGERYLYKFRLVLRPEESSVPLFYFADGVG